MNPRILRFGFLTIIKASQQHFPPQVRGKVVVCHGLMFQVTRYDDDAMEAILAPCVYL